ncbi:MAG TPA: hypothetical protein VM941_10680 [Pyrinomonadaceae bacterium]|nr:hypothetical protein [Pyrinomonadaceae bacterium]
MKIIIALFALISAGLLTLNGQTPKKTAVPADVKIRQRMSMGDRGGTETTLYIKGARMRNEMAGGGAGFTNILQCDLKRTITVNEKTRSYLISPTNSPGTSAGAAEGDGGPAPRATTPAQPPAQRRGGVVEVTSTITDTGERKEMFGFTARHIKTSIVKKASPDACDKDQKIETDGWYIDFQYAFECPSERPKPDPMPVRPQRPDCKDEVRTKTIGTAKLGYPLLVTTTIYQPDGRTSSMTQEVLELSREPLDAALFDVPAGYTLAKDMQELYGMGASTSAGSSAPSNNAGGSSNTGSSSPVTNTANASGAASPKKPGVIRVGLLQPSVQLNSGDPASAAESLRNGFANHLKDANVEVVMLSARSASSALNEARQMECDYVLATSMTVKKGGGSMFGRAIGNIAGAATGIPVGSASGAAIKAKDEVTLAYKLEPLIQGKQSLSNTDKAKASRDGEDVVGPLVQNASKTIKTAVAQN